MRGSSFPYLHTALAASPCSMQNWVSRVHPHGTTPPPPNPASEAETGGTKDAQILVRWRVFPEDHRGRGPHVHTRANTDTLSTRQLKAPPDTPSLSQTKARPESTERPMPNGTATRKSRADTLTKELGGIRIGGLLIVGESFVDDLPDGCVEALQLFILGGHAGSA